MLRKIIHSPYLSLFVGLVLLTTAGFEIWHTYEDAKVGAHHGMLFYSLVHIAKSLPDLKAGISEVAVVVK